MFVDAKQHIAYFKEYFEHLGARTIVVENDYVDRDWLEDFTSYYVRCFLPYERNCTRLHFFTHDFTHADFQALLSGADAPITTADLRGGYLGFIVVKPLPESMIGRTCLQTYADDNGRRQYPITRKYKANLFGIDLKVETLAFQEQDAVAAACATSALWSAFHGTGLVFQHSIPSPVEITKAATRHSPPITRVIPNQDGLTLFQMAAAIRSVGLEPLVIGAGDDFTLKASVYAYLRAQIPLLLTATLFDPSLRPDRTERGLHGLTVTGFSLGSTDPVPHPDGLQLRAYRIDKLYAHDDQIGPFTRMPFLGQQGLGTSWLANDGVRFMHGVPGLLIVPLYHKIRIRLQAILDTLIPFDHGLETLRGAGQMAIGQRIEWDVYLTTVNALKSELLAAHNLDEAYRLEVLRQRMPRFLWRATARTDDTMVLDLLFDATGIERGPFFVRALEYNAVFAAVLRAVAQAMAGIAGSHSRPDWPIWHWFTTPP